MATKTESPDNAVVVLPWHRAFIAAVSLLMSALPADDLAAVRAASLEEQERFRQKREAREQEPRAGGRPKSRTVAKRKRRAC